LEVSGRSGLPFNLALQVLHRPLLGMHLLFQLSDFILLKFDEGVEASRLGIAFVC